MPDQREQMKKIRGDVSNVLQNLGRHITSLTRDELLIAMGGGISGADLDFAIRTIPPHSDDGHSSDGQKTIGGFWIRIDPANGREYILTRQ